MVDDFTWNLTFSHSQFWQFVQNHYVFCGAVQHVTLKAAKRNSYVGRQEDFGIMLFNVCLTLHKDHTIVNPTAFLNVKDTS